MKSTHHNSLLDWAESHARIGDPVTSHIAARDIGTSLSTLEQLFFDALLQLGSATANEVARHATTHTTADHSRESIRKRAGDLVRKNRISVIGHRCCNVTGKPASIYTPLEKP